MRVIAGQFRSRKLAAVPGMDTRPTSDRLRETLFNVAGPLIVDAVFLDLYAGTGAVGIEAISRGAREVYFVESDKKAARVIRQNLQSLKIEDGAEVLEWEAVPALRLLESQAIAADFIYIDPPYEDHGSYAQALGLLAQSRLIDAGSIVIAEHDKHFDLSAEFGALKRYRELKQGDAVLSFYKLT